MEPLVIATCEPDSFWKIGGYSMNKLIKSILILTKSIFDDEKEKNVKIKISKNIKTLEETNNDLIELKSNDSMVKKLVNKFKRD